MKVVTHTKQDEREPVLHQFTSFPNYFWNATKLTHSSIYYERLLFARLQDNCTQQMGSVLISKYNVRMQELWMRRNKVSFYRIIFRPT